MFSVALRGTGAETVMSATGVEGGGDRNIYTEGAGLSESESLSKTGFRDLPGLGCGLSEPVLDEVGLARFITAKLGGMRYWVFIAELAGDATFTASRKARLL